MRRVWLGLVCAVGMVGMAGCGGDGIPRVAVEGAVTLDGSPLNEGSVTFIPVGSGPAAGTTIDGGRYSISRSKGPSPGEYRVEIRSPKPTGKQVVGTDGTTMEPEFKESIPVKYNTRTELTATLVDGERNQVDFHLKK